MLTLSLLGVPRVNWCDQRVHVMRRGVRALLYYLAARHEPVLRDELAVLFWPDAPVRAARKRLSGLCSRLRQALTAAGVPPELLRRDGEYLSLDVQHYRTNLAPFEAAAEAALSAPESIAAAEQAVKAYTGRFLDGFHVSHAPAFDVWLADKRRRLELRHLRLLERLATACIARSEYICAQLYLDDILKLERLRESAHALIIEIHFRQHHRLQAIAQYKKLAGLLHKHLGVAPSFTLEARLKGMPEPPPLYAARSERAAERRVSADLPFAGRDEELRRLLDAWECAQGGTAQVALITGPAGQGKTRLLEELAGAVVRSVGPQRAQVLFARCDPSTADEPYRPIADALGPGLETAWRARAVPSRSPEEEAMWAALQALLPLPHRTPVPADAGGQARLCEAIVRYLQGQAARAPVLLLIDDLQWADPSTRGLLAGLSRRLTQGRFMWVGTLRQEDAAELATWQAELAEAWPTQCVEVGPLSREAVATLVAAADLWVPAGVTLPDVVERFWRESEGNPRFLVSAMQMALASARALDLQAEWPVPAKIRAAVQGRLRALSGLAREVLEAAAVIGRGCDTSLLGHVAGQTDAEVADALDELTRACLVEEHYERYHVAQGNVAEVVLEELGTARRRLLHGRVVAALQRGPQRERSAAELAYHAESACLWDETVHYARHAAAEAGRRYAYAEQAYFATRALEALRQFQPEPQLEAELRLAREEAYHVRGQFEQQVLELMALDRLGSAVPPGVLSFRFGRYYCTRSRWGLVEPALRDAIATLAPGSPEWYEARRLLASCLAHQNRPQEAGEAAAAALESTDRVGDLAA